jgi:hypothetical protein
MGFMRRRFFSLLMIFLPFQLAAVESSVVQKSHGAALLQDGMVSKTSADLRVVSQPAVATQAPADLRQDLIIATLLSFAGTGSLFVGLLYLQVRRRQKFHGEFEEIIEPYTLSEQRPTASLRQEPLAGLDVFRREGASRRKQNKQINQTFAPKWTDGSWDVRFLLDAPQHLLRAFFEELSYQSAIELLSSLDVRWRLAVMQRLNLNQAVKKQLEVEISRFVFKTSQ